MSNMVSVASPCLRVSSSCTRYGVPERVGALSIGGSPSSFASLGLHRHGVSFGVALRSSAMRSCSVRRRRSAKLSVRAGIRAVESYDASFQLQPEADESLRKALSSPVFCAQVAEQSKKGGDVRYEFSGHLFQPVPWSPTANYGMPAEFERYLHDKENFTIINVPPNFMFNAKIFKPSRLCAIYKKV